MATTTIHRHRPARPDLLDEVFESVDSHTPTPDTGSRRDELRTVLRGLAVDLAAEHAVGALFFRRLVLHATSSRREADRLVDLVLAGITPRTEEP